MCRTMIPAKFYNPMPAFPPLEIGNKDFIESSEIISEIFETNVLPNQDFFQKKHFPRHRLQNFRTSLAFAHNILTTRRMPELAGSDRC